MDTEVTAIWLKIGQVGRKPMTIGMIYREHQYLKSDTLENSLTPKKQLDRWKKFISSWKTAAVAGSDIMIMGDLNLDYSRWGQPEHNHLKMVDLVKEQIETLGFHQQVNKFTRSWNSQPDSTVDHVWMNTPQRLIYLKNLPRTFSDHHLLLLSFRTKDKIQNVQEFMKRERRDFNKIRYLKRMSDIDWTEFYQTEDLEIKNSIFEN